MPISPPQSRAAVADEALVRPDWTAGQPRHPARLWLDKNENADPAMIDLVGRVIGEIPDHAHHSYPDSAPLYRKLGAYLGVPPECLLLAAGSDGAIRAVFEAYVEPGDAVVHTKPTFAMYAVYCRMYGARAVALEYRPSGEGPVLDAETVISAVREARPKLVCVANPDSPTGTVFPPDELRAIADAAGAAGALMLVDEAYHPFYAETALPWIGEYPHLVVTRSTGKAWAMAGLRIGYAAAAADVAAVLHKVRPMYETSTLAVAVFERMLDHTDEMVASVRRLDEGKQAFLGTMRGLGLRTLDGYGNFLHVAFGAKARAVHAALDGIVYYRRDSADPCLKGFSRFSATTRERFQPVIERIREAV